MTKPISTKTVKKEVTGALRRGFRSINDDVMEHKWRYGILCFLHGWLITMLLTQGLLSLSTFILLPLEIFVMACTVQMLVKAARRPGRLVHEWALEENNSQQISSLKGNTQEELEKMLQYHLDNGNIEAADKISQRLMNLVDGTPIDFIEPCTNVAVNAPQQIAQKHVDPGCILKVPASAQTNLPSWMQDGAAEEKKEEEKQNLPDWMNS